ncbi:MAG: single-stranded DNA-binding protein [Solirubrobacteraceae bacterium]
MNTVNLTARLTRDPELRSTKAGKSVAKMRLALARPKDSDGEDAGADYVDVTVFGRQAEVCAEYLTKGRRVGIEGRLSHSEWEAEDGSHRQHLEVIARHVEFLDGSRREDGDPDPEPVAVGATAHDDIPF